jgi:prophage regulatory protein
MSDRFLRRREVEQLTGYGKSSIYAKMAAGEFPRPRRVDGRAAVRWEEREILAWKAKQPRAESRA